MWADELVRMCTPPPSLPWASLGLPGLSWGLPGPPWAFLGLFGHLGLTGPSWASLGLTESLCDSLGLTGPHWASLGLFGPPWASWASLGPWTSLGPPGPLWVSLGFPGLPLGLSGLSLAFPWPFPGLSLAHAVATTFLSSMWKKLNGPFNTFFPYEAGCQFPSG